MKTLTVLDEWIKPDGIVYGDGSERLANYKWS